MTDAQYNLKLMNMSYSMRQLADSFEYDVFISVWSPCYTKIADWYDAYLSGEHKYYGDANKDKDSRINE
jgi:hypothetical protein